MLTAAQTWAERAQAELGASRRFRELGARLQAVGVPTALTQLVMRAVRDEEEHAFLCAKLARELGHATGFSKPEDLKAEDAKVKVPSESLQDRVSKPNL